MVLFLLLSIPSVYLFALQFLGPLSNTGRVIRNPLVIGGATFFLYAIFESTTGSLFSDLYRWQDAFLRAAIDDQLFPAAFAILFFLLFFRKIGNLSVAEQHISLLSFLAGFFFLVGIKDLVVQINLLDAVDLFYRPLGHIVLILMIPWSLTMFRTHLDKRYFLLANLFVIHVLVAFACAAQYMNMPLLAPCLMFLPLIQAVFVLVNSKRSNLFFVRVSGT